MCGRGNTETLLSLNHWPTPKNSVSVCLSVCLCLCLCLSLSLSLKKKWKQKLKQKQTTTTTKNNVHLSLTRQSPRRRWWFRIKPHRYEILDHLRLFWALYYWLWSWTKQSSFHHSVSFSRWRLAAWLHQDKQLGNMKENLLHPQAGLCMNTQSVKDLSACMQIRAHTGPAVLVWYAYKVNFLPEENSFTASMAAWFLFSLCWGLVQTLSCVSDMKGIVWRIMAN